MAYKIRVFGYSGIKMIRKNLPQDFSVDSVQVLDEPYLWSQTLTTQDLTPVTTIPQINDKATVVRIEIPDGEKCRYEINPPQREGGVRNASADSPMLVGVDQFSWGEGWTISFIDALNAL